MPLVAFVPPPPTDKIVTILKTIADISRIGYTFYMKDYKSNRQYCLKPLNPALTF